MLEELEKVKSEWIAGEVEREDSKVVVTVLVEVVKVVGVCLNVSEGEEGFAQMITILHDPVRKKQPTHSYI